MKLRCWGVPTVCPAACQYCVHMIFNFCDIPSDFQIDWDTVSAQSDGERTHTHGLGWLRARSTARSGGRETWEQTQLGYLTYGQGSGKVTPKGRGLGSDGKAGGFPVFPSMVTCSCVIFCARHDARHALRVLSSLSRLIITFSKPEVGAKIRFVL